MKETVTLSECCDDLDRQIAKIRKLIEEIDKILEGKELVK